MLSQRGTKQERVLIERRTQSTLNVAAGSWKIPQFAHHLQNEKPHTLSLCHTVIFEVCVLPFFLNFLSYFLYSTCCAPFPWPSPLSRCQQGVCVMRQFVFSFSPSEHCRSLALRELAKTGERDSPLSGDEHRNRNTKNKLRFGGKTLANAKIYSHSDMWFSIFEIGCLDLCVDATAFGGQLIGEAHSSIGASCPIVKCVGRSGSLSAFVRAPGISPFVLISTHGGC